MRYSPRLRWRVLLILIIVACTCWAARQFSGDDALIYARYVRNALQGHGLVFNDGERVNALSSPFFSVLLLSLSWVLRGRVILAEFLLFGFFFTAACGVAERLAPWSGVLIASTMYFYLCLGLETPLFLFMLGLLTLFYIEDRVDWLPLLSILAMLTRFEGAAMVGIIFIQLMRERRLPKLWTYLPMLLVLIAYLVFNHGFYGAWLPSSATGKFEQGFSGYWERYPIAFLRFAPLKAMFHSARYVGMLAMILAVWGIWKERASRMSRVLIPFGLVLGAFYVFCNLPNYHWYYAPFIFFIGVYALRTLPQTKPMMMWVRICLFLAIVQCAWTSLQTMRGALVSPDYLAMGNWLKANTKPDALVAANEIGAVGWYSERPIDDLIGLTNPSNAKRLYHHDLRSWLPAQRPDYVVMKDPPSFGEIAAAESPDYVYLPIHFGHIYLMKRKDSRR